MTSDLIEKFIFQTSLDKAQRLYNQNKLNSIAIATSTAIII